MKNMNSTREPGQFHDKSTKHENGKIQIEAKTIFSRPLTMFWILVCMHLIQQVSENETAHGTDKKD